MVSRSPPRIQTNPRYKNFTQTMFTVGDEEQWESQVSIKELKPGPSVLSPDVNIKLCGQIDSTSTYKTFRYIFHNLKKGIYVRIIDGNLETFIPFSKNAYFNTWSDSITPSNKFSTINDVIKSSQKACGRSFDERRVCRERNNWVTNGHLVRFEYPLREGDTNVKCLHNFIQTLCKERKIQDVEFFLNRRDFPLLKKDGSHPYKPYKGFPLDHYDAPENYLPILSMCSDETYHDIGIPTYEDWGRISYQNDDTVFDSSYQARKNRIYPIIDRGSWDNKIDKAVFRGSSTGCGTTKDTNYRIKLALLAQEFPEYLDCKITEWNTRPRLVQDMNNNWVFDSLDHENFPSLKIGEFLTPQEQSKYKYIINVDGHSTAFRLSFEFSYGSVILLCKSEYDIWYSHLIKPFVHYIPVKKDLSNLIEQIEWCRKHQDKCKSIIKNAYLFYQKYLSRQGVLDYTSKLLNILSHQRGVVNTNYLSPTSILHSREKFYIKGRFTSMKVNMKEFTLLKQTKNSSVYYNKSIVIKNSLKEIELIHEQFISYVLQESHIECMEQLNKLIVYSDKNPAWKYHDGKSLQTFLETTTQDEYLDILHQICGITQELQEKHHFVHNDMYPWNIIIKPTSSIFHYSNSRGKWESLHTGNKVVLIDFGKSHILYKRCHHGNIRPFNFCSLRDILTFLISSVDRILSKYIDTNVLKLCVYCINFIEKCDPSFKRVYTKKDIRKYTKYMKKYTTIVYKDWKSDLEPADFLLYLWSKHQRCNDRCFINLKVNKKEDINLPDDIFDSPEQLIKNIKENRYAKNYTFTKLSKILTTINRANKNNAIFNEILHVINEK